VEIDPEVDTIFEIGGQDSKYISITNTHPLDFDMNKVCAAGTGSFLHELANKYGINIVGEFQQIALSSLQPVRLAERCTVFMESDLVSYHQKGVVQRDLIAGLCYAIVYNYLNRVVGKRKIGKRIMFLGGPSLNKGVVAAFENVLGRGLQVPKHREVMGAYGAAVSVQERMGSARGESRFRGLESAVRDRMDYTEKVCHADPNCQNQCKLKIYDFDGRRSVWGGECGRYELTRGSGRKRENFFQVRQEIWESYLTGVSAEYNGKPLLEVDGRPTVGMQRSLYGLATAILWAHFFDRLGYRLVLSPPTNPQLSRQGIEAMVADEVCYPIKVSHGHVREMVGQTAYLFLPTLINMPTVGPSEVGFYCPMVQSNAHMVRIALHLDRRSILSPVVHLKYDFDTLAMELADQLKDPLRVSGKQIRSALHHALERQTHFNEALYRKGREILETHDPEEPLVVVSGRPYNLYDERLNLRLGQNLGKIGLKGVPMDFIDLRAVDLSDFPSMYWGLGAQILRAARYAREHRHTFGLHLTNFSCGADSFIEHFYKHIMGDKAYLILELDEHSAVAGMMTRLEAYKNVIVNTLEKQRAGSFVGLRAVNRGV
jgi:predicted nucleotide-binding protein (sugar kinase/HSP70/actin superfamily)